MWKTLHVVPRYGVPRYGDPCPRRNMVHPCYSERQVQPVQVWYVMSTFTRKEQECAKRTAARSDAFAMSVCVVNCCKNGDLESAREHQRARKAGSASRLSMELPPKARKVTKPISLK